MSPAGSLASGFPTESASVPLVSPPIVRAHSAPQTQTQAQGRPAAAATTTVEDVPMEDGPINGDLCFRLPPTSDSPLMLELEATSTTGAASQAATATAAALEDEAALRAADLLSPSTLGLSTPPPPETTLQAFSANFSPEAVQPSTLIVRPVASSPLHPRSGVGQLLPAMTHSADCKRITPHTMTQLLRGQYNRSPAQPDHIDAFVVIDCRYDYEYAGGHIVGAININDRAALGKFFRQHSESAEMPAAAAGTATAAAAAPSGPSFSFPAVPPVDSSATPRRLAIIFHCEFSQNRAPKSYRFFRSLDRLHNTLRYPHLSFPELYVLDGGYKQFVHNYPEWCRKGPALSISPSLSLSPASTTDSDDSSSASASPTSVAAVAPASSLYVSMWDPAFEKECKLRTADHRKSWGTTKIISAEEIGASPPSKRSKKTKSYASAELLDSPAVSLSSQPSPSSSSAQSRGQKRRSTSPPPTDESDEPSSASSFRSDSSSSKHHRRQPSSFSPLDRVRFDNVEEGDEENVPPTLFSANRLSHRSASMPKGFNFSSCMDRLAVSSASKGQSGTLSRAGGLFASPVRKSASIGMLRFDSDSSGEKESGGGSSRKKCAGALGTRLSSVAPTRLNLSPLPAFHLLSANSTPTQPPLPPLPSIEAPAIAPVPFAMSP